MYSIRTPNIRKIHQMQREIHQIELYLLLILIPIVGINIIVLLLYSHEALLLISGDAVGHLLSISTNQVTLVLLCVVGGVDPCIATLVSNPSIRLQQQARMYSALSA
jgi:hypothetical protein